MAARIAMIAMTTRSSIRVKARWLLRFISVPSRTAGEPPGKDAFELTIRRNRARLLPCLITGLGLPHGTLVFEGIRTENAKARKGENAKSERFDQKKSEGFAQKGRDRGAGTSWSP